MVSKIHKKTAVSQRSCGATELTVEQSNPSFFWICADVDVPV